MVKVKCKNKSESIYPCIKISRITGEVVLFSGYRRGHVLKSEVVPLLQYSTIWVMDDFEDYPGIIELKNA